jgi:hypothetical protein
MILYSNSLWYLITIEIKIKIWFWDRTKIYFNSISDLFNRKLNNKGWENKNIVLQYQPRYLLLFWLFSVFKAF